MKFTTSSLIQMVTIAALSLMAGRAAAAPFDQPLRFYAFDNRSNETLAMDFDASGRVVGAYNVGFSETRRGFLRSADGSYTDLVDPSVVGANWSMAVAMNERGTVVGWSEGEASSASWAYDVATGIYSPIAFPGARSTRVTDINESGVVVGYASFRAGDVQTVSGFVLKDGAYQEITTAGSPFTRLYTINDLGQIGGQSGPEGSSGSTFIIEPDSTRTPITNDIFPSVLTNNGVILDACVDGDFIASICAAKPSSRIKTLPGPACDYASRTPTSVKGRFISGYCNNIDSSGQGFVVRLKGLK